MWRIRGDAEFINGMGNGEWGMGNGKWEMGNGKWEMGNGLKPISIDISNAKIPFIGMG